jgi:hypothetical protein
VISKFKKLVRANEAMFLFRMAILATLDKGLPGKPHLRTVGSTVAVSCFTIRHVLSVNLAGKRKIVS